DLVVVALPGAVLPGGFAIAQRKTYGRVSDGMICSSRELDLGDDHDGILVLAPGSAEVGTAGTELLTFGEEVLDIAVTPDRGYALSIRGIAREAAIACDLPFRDRATELAPLPAPATDAQPRPCALADPSGCDVFTLRTLLDVDATTKSPLWLTQRLVAAGMRPVSLIVDVTNYVMLETGQPLHAFDADRVAGGLVARRAVPGESLETLDHVTRELDSEDLVIADDSGPLALAGTMGGTSSEIDDQSRNILLEAAHFDEVVVARMSRRHRLSSEASRRFERGVDRALAPYASERAASLILELAGGRSAGMTAEEAPHEPLTIAMSADLPGRVAGMDIAAERVIANLSQVGCSVSTEASALVVEPPTWRPDLTDPADLVEEVIRLIGYDHITPTLPSAPAGRGLTEAQQCRRRASRAAVAFGLIEVLSYPFIGEHDLDLCQIPADDHRRNFVRLANPLSDEQPGIRTTLLPGLLNAARRNVSRGADDGGIFEVGSVAFGTAGDAVVPPRLTASRPPSADELDALAAAIPTQRRHLAGLAFGSVERPGWWGVGRDFAWSDALRIATGIVEDLGVATSVDAAEYLPFHPGRCAVLSIVDQESADDTMIIGYAGELHPKVCASWGLPPRTCAFELDLDAVIAAATDEVRRGPRFHSMPVAKEDIALVVPVDTAAADVAAALADGAGALLESVRLFDVYQGPQVAEGSKSLTFSLRFRAADRTLGVDELSQSREAAIAAAESACGASLRT
ncbi:MAG: phenylalanine--tRNA ligase subunit beta, partial [Candidatus Nanopelagicales bacterium]